MTEPTSHELTRDLADMASSLEALRIPGRPEQARLAGRRDWIVRTVRDYLIPRIEDPATPLTVVFAGPTGAGKSTLLNSVAGAEHSVAGPLRPTTKSPLVLCSKSRADNYATVGGIACQVVTGRAPILDELALVDTPDIDSTSTEHRAIAETVIDHADIVVYVTSALRYADLVPWEVLRRAHSRGVPVIHVLNRITSSTSGAPSDYSSRLELEGLESDLIAVHEHHMTAGSQEVPLVAIQELRDRLVEVVEMRRAGSADVVRSVLDTILDQAGDVTAVISGIASEASDASDRAKAELAVDLDRIAGSLPLDVNEVVGLDSLSNLAARRFRTRGMVRRRLPPPTEIATARNLLDGALIGAVDADVSRQLEASGVVRGADLAGLLSETHAIAAGAVAAWNDDLAEMSRVRGAPDDSLAALLIATCSLQAPSRTLSDALTVVIGGDAGVEIGQAGERLSRHLAPIYSNVGYQVLSRLGKLTASRAAVDRVKTSTSAVIARSSFANA